MNVNCLKMAAIIWSCPNQKTLELFCNPCVSSRGGLVERLLHKLHDSISVGSNLARRQKDFRSYSNTMSGALINE